MALRVAEPVFAAVRQRRPIARRCHPFEILNGPIPIHFQVDADSAVEWALGEVYAQVRDAHFDNLGKHLVRLLIKRDTYLGRMAARRDRIRHERGQYLVANIVRQLEELVCLPAVLVPDRHARLLPLLVIWMALLDHLVEIVVVRLVLDLVHNVSLMANAPRVGYV